MHDSKSNQPTREDSLQAVDSTEEYDVLISYSRENIDFARRLEARLKAYRPPPELGLPQRHLRVFRDENDLFGPDYPKAIGHALRTSAKLLVLCSPQARSSSYVGDEIEQFAKHKGALNIISVLVAGVPNNEVKPGQDADAAFPEALCAAMEMPLAIDYQHFDLNRDKIDRGVFLWKLVLASRTDF
jgi:hypothetical protein